MNRSIPDVHGLQVFLVEDDSLIALMIKDMLAELGCAVVGEAHSIAEALSWAETMPAVDLAILDVNIKGEVILPVADMFARRQVPLLFSTGYGTTDLLQLYPGSRLLAKPYGPDALALALASSQTRH